MKSAREPSAENNKALFSADAGHAICTMSQGQYPEGTGTGSSSPFDGACSYRLASVDVPPQRDHCTGVSPPVFTQGDEVHGAITSRSDGQGSITSRSDGKSSRIVKVGPPTWHPRSRMSSQPEGLPPDQIGIWRRWQAILLSEELGSRARGDSSCRQ